ncbi:cytochrome c [bacterium AH-315-I20]|nr:cytochrome c [bacterium AH-315-I20]
MLKKPCSYHFCIALAVTIATAPMSVAEEAVAPLPTVDKSSAAAQSQTKRGKLLFNNLCKHCHTITYDESRIGAPGLQGVLERHDETWLHQWIKSPETFAKTNVAARDLIDDNQFGLAMPTLPMMQDDDNRSAIIEYLKTLK